MLRVLQVIGKMDRAGAETMLMNIYRHVDRSKVQFDFMVFTDEEGDYDQEIKSLGGKIYHMPAFKGYNYFNLKKRFKLFFSKHSYEIVHGHIGSLAPAYLKVAKEEGAYTVAHSHATNSTRLLERIIFEIFAHKVRYIGNYFFACSKQAGVDRFGKEVVSSNRFQVINNAIDCEKYRYDKEKHEQLKKQFGFEERTILGHVGRFSPEKNHRFIIEVLKKMCDVDDKILLVLVGRGPEEEMVKQLVYQNNLEKYVKFLGVRDDVPDLMNMFDAFIFPSTYEGLGIVGIEAQAAGLPCFFSDAIPEEAIITPDVTCIPLSKSSDEWARIIEGKIQKYQRKDNYSYIMDANYDIKQVAKNIEEFYLEKRKEMHV
ncbi:glycosyltransferase family 1 protein [Dorea sp. AM58-8]|nr:glycosyltransferase family 1 protein [Dorea sp. AM58-8]